MRNLNWVFKSCLILALGSLGGFSCAPKSKKSSNAPTKAIEEGYCSTVVAPTSPIVITSSAIYEYYKAVATPGAMLGLTKDTGGVPFTNPIRRAEVRIKNSSGVVVQCGVTDNAGAINITIEKPTIDSTYSIEVNARGDSSYVKASILDKVSTKLIYTITASFTIASNSTSITVPALVASATGTLEGGAFHIFDRILQVNEFLRSNSTDANCPGCQAFSVAPKVTVFWAKGFNPASYFGETSPLSFYDGSASIDSSPALYVLGGSEGDVDYADTDHFDESVIIHEYGHFLENTFWRSDSPGGYHNGNMTIDPRLAFSEGFANFLPSAVMGRSTYIDTIGSPNGSAGIGVFLDLENETGSFNSGIRDKIIAPSPIGEGIYREVSVSRAFYDYIDAASDLTYNINGTSNVSNETSQFSFAYIWEALTNATFGVKSPNNHFISMGHFNKALYAAMDASSFSSISSEKAKLDTARIGEMQPSDTSEYAALVTPTSSCSLRTMTPVSDRTSSDGSSYHDYFASSDFYRIDHPGGVLSVSLSWYASADLDLYIFKEAHSLTEERDVVAKSETPSVAAGTEAVSVDLAAGTYLIFVNVDTSSSFASSVTYDLKSGGQFLCNSP